VKLEERKQATLLGRTGSTGSAGAEVTFYKQWQLIWLLLRVELGMALQELVTLLEDQHLEPCPCWAYSL
jgi:hypothetical protein